jgi:hypothetical protein
MTATLTFPTTTQSLPAAGRAEVAERATAPALIAGATFDAISMPAAFGALVLAELDIMMLAGPVVADGDGSWTFLTRPADTRQPAVPTDLLPLGVRAVPAGTPVAPLAGADRPGRPPAIWWTVIGAARRVAHRTGRVA